VIIARQRLPSVEYVKDLIAGVALESHDDLPDSVIEVLLHIP